jgi:hypothetical protein
MFICVVATGYPRSLIATVATDAVFTNHFLIQFPAVI